MDRHDRSGHDHRHDHGHGHHHAPASFDAAFALGMALNLGFVGVETAYGLAAGSMALVADAGHNLGDVLGLAMAWIASALVRRRPSARRTYGLRRSSILASVANAVIMLVAVGAIAIESARRLFEPEPVATTTIMLVAAAGIAINGLTALLFYRSGERDLNIRGVVLHMAADAAVSLGVVLAAAAIRLTGWLWLDPAGGIAISLVILLGTWSLLRDSINLALDAVPEGIDPMAVGRYLGDLPGVTEVHDLHIWAMSTTETALTVHLIRPGGALDDGLLARVARELKTRFGIAHSTMQVEEGDIAHPCHLAPAETV